MQFLTKNALALRLVFSKPAYVGLFVIIFLALFLPLAIVTEFIFFEPSFLFYVPHYAVFDFLAILVISILTGLVLSMSIFRIRFLQASSKKLRTGLLGSIIGAGAGACCGGIGFALIFNSFCSSSIELTTYSSLISTATNVRIRNFLII